MASVVNITTESDADFRRAFTYQTTLAVAIDLTAATMVMKLRRHVEDKTAALTLTTENGGIVITNAAAGKFQLVIDNADLERLPADIYQQSLVMSQGGAQTLIWRGTLTHTDGPSR